MPAASNLALNSASKDFLEEILEAAVIGFEDGVLGGKVNRPAEVQTVVHAGPGEAADGVIQIVHGERHAAAGKIEDLTADRLAAVFRLEGDGQFALAGHDKIGGAVLVADRHDGR